MNHAEDSFLTLPNFFYQKLLRCNLCEYTTLKPYNLKSHVGSVHEKEKSFNCDLCDMVFGRKLTLDRHINSVHEKEKAFICDLCGESFGRKDTLKKHRNLVHDKVLNYLDIIYSLFYRPDTIFKFLRIF